MPYVTSYVDDGKGLHKNGSGILTGLEIFTSAMQEGINVERAQKLRYGLIDFSEVTEMRVTPDDIRRIVEVNRRLAAFTQGALVAIVAPGPLPYAMSRLWHTFSQDLGWKSNVFHTRVDALAWLRKQFTLQSGSETVLDEFPSLKQIV